MPARGACLDGRSGQWPWETTRRATLWAPFLVRLARCPQVRPVRPNLCSKRFELALILD
jgi:hypothetical protein